MMWAIIISNVQKFGLPLCLFIWSLFKPALAGYVYLGGAALFVGYLFLTDILGKPNPDPAVWAADEREVLKKYHLALRFPLASNDMSVYLNGIRWSSFLWVPWLLWNHDWIASVFLAANFFASGLLSVRLAPFFFLGDAVRRGHYQFAAELSLLQSVAQKLNEKHS